MVQITIHDILHNTHAFRIDPALNLQHEACLYILDVVHIGIILILVDSPQLVLIPVMLVAQDTRIDRVTAVLDV